VVRIRVAAPVILVGIVGAIMASCGGGEKVAGPSQPPLPAQLEIVAGNNQTAPVATELADALVVRAVDANGAPISGQLVNFRVVKGGGSVFAGSALTGVDGVAQERWTLGTVARDTQQVEARAIDSRTGEKIVFAVFKAVGQAGAAVELRKVVGDSQPGVVGAALPESLVVRLVDAYGNGESGSTVTWTTGSGSLSTATSITDTAGRAAVRWTLGTAAGPQQSTARAGTLPAVIFAATAGGGPVAHVRIDIHPETLYVEKTMQLSATATDMYGNARSDAVAWSLTEFSQFSISITPNGLVTATDRGWPRVVATVGSVADTTALITIYPVRLVEVTLGRSRLHAGDTTHATVRLFANTDEVVRPYSFASEDTTLATVDASGLVTARRNGRVGILAQSEGRTGVSVLDVVPYGARTVTIDPRSVTLIGGQSIQLTATAIDSLGQVITNPAVFWSASNLAIAEISSAGIVHAKALGRATIRALLDAGADTIPVEVVNGPVVRVTLTPQGGSSLYSGDSTLVNAYAADQGGNKVPGKTFMWSSSDSSRLRVTAVSADFAYAVALKPGLANVIASVDGVSGSAPVNVLPHVNWSQMASPTTQSISAVWGRSATDAYAAAPGGVLHFDGSSWTDMGSGTAYERFWSTSPTNLFARIGGTLFQYDGTRWSEVALAPPSGPFKNIWASSVDDVWAIFFDGALARDRLAHLSGGVWTVSDLTNGMYDIWGVSSNDVWVTGYKGQTFRFDGAVWSEISNLGIGNTGLWVGSNRPDTAWIYYQGNSSGHLSQFSHRGGGVFDESQVYWSGTAYDNAFTAPQALWSADRDDLYTIQDGTVYRFSGVVWPRRSSVELSGPGYRGLWGSGRIVFVVGDGGVIMRGEIAP